MYRNIFKIFRNTFKMFWNILPPPPRTFCDFLVNNLKCFECSKYLLSRTFLMFWNILQSSKQQFQNFWKKFWNFLKCSRGIWSGTFQNVQELFKMFHKTFCHKKSKNELHILQICSGTFKMFRNIFKMFRNIFKVFWNILPPPPKTFCDSSVNNLKCF